MGTGNDGIQIPWEWLLPAANDPQPPKPGRPKRNKAKAKAKKQADDFETMFLEQMTEKLFAGETGEGPLGENGTGGGVYRSMLTQEYARSLQKAGGLGLSDQILRDLIQVQAKATATAKTTATATTGGGGNAG